MKNLEGTFLVYTQNLQCNSSDFVALIATFLKNHIENFGKKKKYACTMSLCSGESLSFIGSFALGSANIHKGRS